MPFEGVPRSFGMLYALLVILAVFFLLRRHTLHRPTRTVILLASILSGLILFAPMTPIAFEVLVLHLQSSMPPLVLTITALLVFIITTFLTGKIFCGYCCPIGAAQEILYYIPVPKILLRQSPHLLVLRAVLVTACIAIAFFVSINLLLSSLVILRGARDAFLAGGFTVFSILFAGVLVVSIVLYRPFCRFACPYGALCSLAAANSLYRIRKSPGCTACDQCLDACPTGEAGPRHLGSECYLCGRCLDACPAPDTLTYRRR